MYNIELNIKFCTVILAHELEEIGKKNGFEVSHHGWDRLVYIGSLDHNFTKLIYELRITCKENGINFTDLQILDWIQNE